MHWMTHLHAAVYRRSGGRLLTRMGKQPVLLLTTTGRRTGQARTTPVQYLVRGEDLLIVGADRGAPHPPAWVLNLHAEPLARIQVGSEVREVRARAVSGRERTETWHELCKANRLLPSIETKARRPLDVFALEPTVAVALHEQFPPLSVALEGVAGPSHQESP